MKEDASTDPYNWGEDPPSDESGAGLVSALPPAQDVSVSEGEAPPEDESEVTDNSLALPETEESSAPDNSYFDFDFDVRANEDPPAVSAPAIDESISSLAASRSIPPESEHVADIEDLVDETSDTTADSLDPGGVEKLGIVGGKGVGKSYLFQAMVYRTCSGIHSGALSYYLRNESIRLFSAIKREEGPATLNLNRFIDNYSKWIRLPQTNFEDHIWYRLRLHYRTGFLGRHRSTMDVEFFDGSGEGFFSAMRTAENRALWKEGFLDATVMVFCLPLWAAFPASHLSTKEWTWRDEILEGFEQVVQNFTDLRDEHNRTHPVSTILALTMADDKRSSLETLRDRWITPYMEASPFYLQNLRKGGGVARYLGNARRVSEALHEEFAASRDPLVASIPQKLDFYGGRPWLVPLSAVDGTLLDHLENNGNSDQGPVRLPAPVPVHVELPLLVALCERHNALL